ncbi:MAG: RidA family protein [Proteobacteria bacterium]|nr:RidA family protein [Burkholderiales bacterium]
MIKRISGGARGRNRACGYKDLVWAVATAADVTLDVAGQTRQTLATIEKNLAALGASKHSIASAQIFVADIHDKDAMDQVWCEWLGDNPDHWPQRACVGVALRDGALVEITVTAVKV